MSKKKYLAPQISIIMFEPQAILAGSGEASTPGDFTTIMKSHQATKKKVFGSKKSNNA